LLIAKDMKVVLADSNELIRIGLRSVLENYPEIEIIGEAVSSHDLWIMCEKTPIDEVIIDYTSDGFSIDIVPKIIQKRPDINVIAITPEQSATTLINALKSGVKSYVKKDCSVTEIMDAIIETGKGNNFFCGKILETIQKANINIEDLDSDVFSCEPVSLSERENEIIKMIAEGLTNIQIAEQLFLSNHTVNTHRKNIMSKLGVKNTAGIVMYAVKMNIVSPNKFLFASEGN